MGDVAALRSVFVDGSTRGRTLGTVEQLVVAEDGRSAIFVCARSYYTDARAGRVSLDDGEVTLTRELPRVTAHVSTRPEAIFCDVGGAGVTRVDLASGDVTTTPTNGTGALIACSRDGGFFALRSQPPPARAHEAVTTIVRRGDGAAVASFPGGQAAFSDDGRVAVTVDRRGVVEALDLWDGTVASIGRVEPDLGEDSLTPERGGRRFVHLRYGSPLTLLDPDGRSAKALLAPGVGCYVVHGFAAGRCLAVVHVEGKRQVVVLDVDTGRMTRLPTTIERRAALSPDGSFMLRARDHGFERYDLATGETRTWHDGHETVVSTLAWSRDSARLATGTDAGMIRVLDPDGGEVRWTLEVRRSDTTRLCFSADGRTLYSSSRRVFAAWDLRTGAQTVANTYLTQRTTSLVASNDGRWLAVIGDHRGPRLLDVSGAPRSAGSIKVESDRLTDVTFDGDALRWLGFHASGWLQPIRAFVRERDVARWFDVEGRELDAVTFPADVGPFLPVDGAPSVFVARRGAVIVEARRVLGRGEVEVREVPAALVAPRLLCAGAGVVVCEEGPRDARSLVALALDDGRELGRVTSLRGFQIARVSPDGRRLAVAYADGGVEVFALPATRPSYPSFPT